VNFRFYRITKILEFGFSLPAVKVYRELFAFITVKSEVVGHFLLARNNQSTTPPAKGRHRPEMTSFY
jgi:hypothetical protein